MMMANFDVGAGSIAPSQATSRSSVGGGRNLQSVLMRSSVFPVLGLLHLKHVPRDLTIFGMLWEWVQPIALVLNPHMGGHREVFSVIYFLLLPIYDAREFGTGFPNAAVLAIFWVVALFVLATALVVTTALFRKGAMLPAPVMATVAVLSNLLSGVLYMPALSALLAVVTCGPKRSTTTASTVTATATTTTTTSTISASTLTTNVGVQLTTTSDQTLFMMPDQQCDFGGDAVFTLHFVCGVVVSLVLFIGAYLFQSVVFEAKTQSFTHPRRRAHTFLDRVEVIAKSGLVVAFHLMVSRDLHSGFAFVFAATSLFLGGLFAFMMPYFSADVNNARVIVYFVSAWAAIVVYIDQRLGHDDSSERAFKGWPEYVMLAGGALIIAIPAGIVVANLRICRQTQHLLNSALHTNFVPSHENPFAIAAQAADPDLLPYPTGLPKSDLLFSQYATVQFDIVDESIQQGGEDVPDMSSQGDPDEQQRYYNRTQVVSPTIEAIWVATDVEVATRFTQQWVAITSSPPTVHMLSFACRLFSKGTLAFPDSAQVRIHFVRFLSHYTPSAARLGICLQTLDALPRATNPDLMTLYQVYSFSAELRKTLGLRDKGRRDLLVGAERYHREALAQTIHLWRSLSRWSQSGELSQLSVQCAAITDRRNIALATYTRAASISADDDVLLQSFSKFLSDVVHSQDGAMQLKQQADSIASTRRAALLRTNAAAMLGGSISSGVSMMNPGGTNLNVSEIVDSAMQSSTASSAEDPAPIRYLLLMFGFVLLCGAGTFGASLIAMQEVRKIELAEQALARMRAATSEANVLVQTITYSIRQNEVESLPVDLKNLEGLAEEIQSSRNTLLYGPRKIHAPRILKLWTMESMAVTTYTATHTTSASGASTQVINKKLTSAVLFDILGDFIAALHTVSNTPSSAYSTIPELPMPLFAVDAGNHAIRRGLARLSKEMLDFERDQVTLFELVIVGVFLVTLLSMLATAFLVVYQLRQIVVHKAKVLQLFFRVPRHAILQMTSACRTIYNAFVAAEQDADAGWRDEDDTASDNASSRAGLLGKSKGDDDKKTDGGGVATDGAGAATGAEGDDANKDAVKLTDDEMKHSALLASIVRRGSVTLVRDETDHHEKRQQVLEQHGNDLDHVELAPQRDDIVEADFESLWKKAAVDINAVAPWSLDDDVADTASSLTAGGHHHSHSTHGAPPQRRVNDRSFTVIVITAVLTIVLLVASSIVSVIAAMSVPKTTDIEEAASRTTEIRLFERKLFERVLEARTFALGGEWRSLAKMDALHETVVEEKEILLTARWPDESFKYLISMLNALNETETASFISTTLTVRALQMDPALAGGHALTDEEISEMLNGTRVLWTKPSHVELVKRFGPIGEEQQPPYSYDVADLGLNASTIPLITPVEQMDIAVKTLNDLFFDAAFTKTLTTAQALAKSLDVWSTDFEKETKAHEVTVLVSIGLLAAGLLGAVAFGSFGGLAFLSDRPVVAGCAVIVLMSTIVQLAALGSALAVEEHGLKAHLKLVTAVHQIDAYEQGIEMASHLASSYVISSEPLLLRRFMQHTSPRLDAMGDSIVLKYTSKILGITSRALVLDRISKKAVALAAIAFSDMTQRDLGPLQFPQLFQVNWDNSTNKTRLTFPLDYQEPSLQEWLTVRPNGTSLGPFPSNKVDDLSYPVEEQKGIARRALASEELRSALHAVTAGVLELRGLISDDLSKKRTDDFDTSKGLIYAAAAAAGCCVLGIVVALVALAQAVMSSVTQTSKAVEELYRKEFRHAERTTVVSLLLLAFAMVVATAVASVVLLQKPATMEVINAASGRTIYLENAVSFAERLSTAVFTDHAAPADLTEYQKQMKKALESARVARRDTYFSARGASLRNSMNTELFGASTMTPSALPSSTLACYASFSADGGNQRFVDTQFLVVVSLLEQISALDAAQLKRTNSTDQKTLKALLIEIHKVARTASHSLDKTTTKLEDAFASTSNRDFIIVCVVFPLVLLLVLLLALLIFRPMIGRLADEIGSMTVLLGSLPEDVKSNVPEIFDFFNSGDIGDEVKKNLQQSERLLQNILPPVISRRLKSGESPIADDHPDVTVMFAALVGFDEYSASMESRDMVVFLNRLTVTFDDIVDQLDLEKIKTIGDTYFLCGGLTKKTVKDHALRAMECALCFIDALNESNDRHGTPNLKERIGLMTGAAVAGVIGSTKVAYDLWGDTVNTASRMQSTGIPGKVQSHQKTWERIKQYFAFEENQVNAKGKGTMTTYLYSSRKGTPSPLAGKVNWRKTMQ